jgi:FkbH-like protein
MASRSIKVKTPANQKVIVVISDFNVAPLSGHLKNKLKHPEFVFETAPYGQVYQSLARSNESWLDIVWTLPERILPGFNKALQLECIKHDDILTEVDDFAESLIRASNQRYIFVAAWHLPASNGYGILDWQENLGLSSLLAKCNLRLSAKISAHNNIFMLPTHRWMEGIKQPISKKMWYATKVPYVSDVFEAAAENIQQSVSAINGTSRRLIIVDLDHTLWGGVVGETGWQGVRLGGHDHVGEAFKDFQLALKALSNRGVQLAISSKNDEAVALEAIDNHPEMVLRREDFVGWRINWDDKAANIVELANEVNLGFESIVFIDDNPAERMRVSSAIPEVLVPEWPKDPAMYVETLLSLCYFDTTTITNEDRSRTTMYVSERERQSIKQSVGSNDDWLRRIRTNVIVRPVNPSNISRVAQLFNKTNQLNLSTRRLSEQEINSWRHKGTRSMMAISVSDQFGDMGLVGVVSVEVSEARGRLVDLILSCRVMGRRVEETLIYLAVTELEKLGATTMDVVYKPTDRNRPTLEVLEGAKLEKIDAQKFRVDFELGYEKPNFVELNFVNE